MTAPAPSPVTHIDPWGPGPESLLVLAQMHLGVRRAGVAVEWDRASQTWTVDGVAGLGWDEAVTAVRLGGGR